MRICVSIRTSQRSKSISGKVLTLSTGNYFDKVREKENHSGKGAAIWIRTKKKKRSGVNYNNIINLHVMRFGGKNISGWRADYFVFEGGG